jgi:hypothetical protein
LLLVARDETVVEHDEFRVLDPCRYIAAQLEGAEWKRGVADHERRCLDCAEQRGDVDAFRRVVVGEEAPGRRCLAHGFRKQSP